VSGEWDINWMEKNTIKTNGYSNFFIVIFGEIRVISAPRKTCSHPDLLGVIC
jgi:hypothetical protein